jgi:sugar lactone lactonase YvrE
MHRPFKRARWGLTAVVAIVAGLVGGVLAIPVQASPPGETTIVLPGARSAEGIAAGEGTTFYAGELFTGTIFRGDIRTGAVSRFIDAPQGRMALGLRVDRAHHLLFVAGGFTGQAYIYNSDTGAQVATYQLATGSPVINDVAVTPQGAWFTDSSAPQLHFIPVSAAGVPGPARTLTLHGPAAVVLPGFNNNGIQATADGRTLVVAHTNSAVLNTVNPSTGDSATIKGVSVPNVDGIVLGGRTVVVVQNFSNQVSQVQLSGNLTSGRVVKTITSSHFEVPTTVARFGDRLAVGNAKFDTGFAPTARQFEVIVVDR